LLLRFVFVLVSPHCLLLFFSFDTNAKTKHHTDKFVGSLESCPIGLGRGRIDEISRRRARTRPALRAFVRVCARFQRNAFMVGKWLVAGVAGWRATPARQPASQPASHPPATGARHVAGGH